MDEHQKDLGTSEKETLQLYTQEFLTPKQIAKRRGLAQSTIRNQLASLRRKGYLTKGNRQHQQVPSCMPHEVVTKKLRLHGEEFHVKILNTSTPFLRRLGREKDLFLDGSRVRLSKDSLRVWSGMSFWGDSVEQVESAARDYWLRFFSSLEHELNVLLLKPRSKNIRRVKHHVAEVGNELAVDVNARKERLRVSGSDGMEWLLVDASFGFNELETVHPLRASSDMRDVVIPFFNDLRDNKVSLPSIMEREAAELRGVVFELSKALSVTHQQLQMVISLVSPMKPSDGLQDASLADYYG